MVDDADKPAKEWLANGNDNGEIWLTDRAITPMGTLAWFWQFDTG